MIKENNKRKGISLIVLLITIAVILILLTTITFSASNVINNTKKRQFAKEIYEVQNLVDKYKYENGDYPYIMENEVKQTIVVNTRGDTSQFENEDISNNTLTLYPINLSNVGVENLSRGTKKNNNENDVYAFSSKTGKVYYVKGYKVGNNIYYTLNDELKKLIGISTNTAKTDSKVIGEIEYDGNYIQDGLILYLDGINNTRNGHSDTTQVWEDLSGNNIDLVVNNSTVNWENNCAVFSSTQMVNNEINIDCLTAEVVLKPTTLGSSCCIGNFGKYGNVNERVLFMSGTKAQLSGNNSSMFISEYEFSNDNIVTVTCQYGDVYKFFANTKEYLKIQSANVWSAQNYNIQLGANRDPTNYSYNGRIYAVRLYNRILTKEEIMYNHSIDRQRFLF